MIYYLGLDLGTDSLGWAITDAWYKVLRKKGKDAWGVRKFEKADSAVERRTARIARRRRQREQVRVGLLKKYFDVAISEIDPYFFQRLENSKYIRDDKDEEVKTPNGIFDDADFTDKEYYKKYPTIFHLRKAQLENKDDAFDPRLVYLSLLNMYRHRGHFLSQMIGDAGSETMAADAFRRFAVSADDILGAQFDETKSEQVIDILSDRGLSRKAKAEKICENLSISSKNKQDIRIILITAFCGLKVDARKIFTDVQLEESVDINFSDYSYEDKATEIENLLGSEYYSLIENMKNLFDAGSVSSLLKGYEYLSMARVASYEKHKADLALLKFVYRNYLSQEKYDKMFRSNKSGTYSAYVGSVNSRNFDGVTENGTVIKRLRRDMESRSREALYKTIKADIEGVDFVEKEAILSEMESESFLPKQLTPGNGIIPNQIHKAEMRKILSNAAQHLSFLDEVDNTGYSVSEQILQLFSFQIPYYIGPVTERSCKDGGNGWVVRKAEGMILPWNMTDLIDDAATREKFIYRLIRECSYISGEKVLPKGSLAYERYCVLNEINNICIDGEKIPVELKQDIFKDLFEKGKRVTRKELVKYLQNKGCLNDESQLSGIDTAINNSLVSYGRFYAIFGNELKKDSVKKAVEEIISLCTIYGDSKKLLQQEIADRFGNLLSPKDIKRIIGYKFKDWGRLSAAVLGLQGVCRETGELLTLSQAMWETNYNFMELINGEEFSFREALKERTSSELKTLTEFESEDLDEYYFPASVKRMVWQTLKLIREITDIMGSAPERIFIEMTRTDEEKGDKGRKDSRKADLLALYKNIKDEDRNWAEEIEEHDADGSLRSKKLFLYYRQMGQCLYTGESITLYQLLNENEYDIDHIYPRHFVKDDNIANNLVLVKKSCNAYKSDNYPIPEVPEKAKQLWKRLHDQGFMNDEKYRRLISRKPFTDEQKADFIARQLVETSQGTKGVADLLKQLLPESTIVYSKASNVSEFRKKFHFYKCRSLNDFHHAKDAYLNIVVGNVYYTKFTQNPLHFIRKEYEMDRTRNNYNLGKMFERDVVRDGYTAWTASREEGAKSGTILTVRKMMEKNTPIITEMCVEAHGAISNATVYSKRKAKPENYIPVKSSDSRLRNVAQYGGMTSMKIAKLALVSHTVGKARKLTFEPVYVYKNASLKTEEDYVRYFKEVLHLNNPVLVKVLKLNSLIKLDGYLYRIAGIDSRGNIELHNSVSLILDADSEEYIHKLEKIADGRTDDFVTAEGNEKLYDAITKRYHSNIFKKKDKMNPQEMTEGDRAKTLDKGREQFIKLSVKEQCEVLMLILDMSKKGVNLSKISGGSEEGRIRISGNMTKRDSLVLIKQSVTGLYESTENLLKL